MFSITLFDSLGAMEHCLLFILQIRYTFLMCLFIYSFIYFWDGTLCLLFSARPFRSANFWVFSPLPYINIGLNLYPCIIYQHEKSNFLKSAVSTRSCVFSSFFFLLPSALITHKTISNTTQLLARRRVFASL